MVDGDPATVPLAELDLVWDFDDPAESERRFAALLPRARDENDGVFLVEALTQLARARGLRRRFDEADATLDAADAALRPDDDRGRIRIALERGRVANTAGRGGRGRSSFLSAWGLARTAGEDALAVDAAHMLGIVESGDEAERWNERAMELASSSPDPNARRWVGSIANNRGWARHEAGDVDGAIALFELARDDWLADGRVGRARVARWSIARCLRSRGHVDEALAAQERLLAELDDAGETDGYVLEEIAECLLALGRRDDARPFFARAHAELAYYPQLLRDEP
jgi:tetratricopeptide (TPR) repeat protein